MVLKEGNGRGVAVKERKKYTEKCNDLTMIEQKRLKGKFKGPYVKSRTT